MRGLLRTRGRVVLEVITQVLTLRHFSRISPNYLYNYLWIIKYINLSILILMISLKKYIMFPSLSINLNSNLLNLLYFMTEGLIILKVYIFFVSIAIYIENTTTVYFILNKLFVYFIFDVGRIHNQHNILWHLNRCWRRKHELKVTIHFHSPPQYVCFLIWRIMR